MGLFGKFAKAIIANASESAGDSKKSSKTATSPELRGMAKQIEKDLEKLDKDYEDLSKSLDKLAR